MAMFDYITSISNGVVILITINVQYASKNSNDDGSVCRDSTVVKGFSWHRQMPVHHFLLTKITITSLLLTKLSTILTIIAK